MNSQKKEEGVKDIMDIICDWSALLSVSKRISEESPVAPGVTHDDDDRTERKGNMTKSVSQKGKGKGKWKERESEELRCRRRS